MRLLYTLTAYPPSMGGAQLHTHFLAQQMLTRHSVEVVSIWDNNRTDWLFGTTLRTHSKHHTYVVDGINVRRLGLSTEDKFRLIPYVMGYYPLMKYAVPSIAKRLKKRIVPFTSRIDIVHNVRIGREPLSYASFELARERDVPFAFTPLHHPRWVGWRYRMYIHLYQMADLVICLTNSEKEILIRLGVKEERIFVTGIGPVLAPTTEPGSFLDKYSIDGPFVLFLGQHYAYKGYKQVLDAAELVWQKVPETHFVFMGPPVGRSEQVFESKIGRRIHRLGKVDLQEKSDALSACTLLCVPSTQESFGGVYTEAWNFGKPVIGCNIPSVADVIADGDDGCLVKQETEEIADRIKFLLLNQNQAKVMGHNGRNKLLRKYTWPRLARLTEQAYEKVLL